MDHLRCIMLPIHEEKWIVPYAALAEVVIYQEPEQVAKKPAWLLGKFNWRDLKIPLICVEKIEDNEINLRNPNLHVAVLNRMSANQSFDFVGMLLQSIPKMTRIRSNDIKWVSKGKKSYQLMEVMVREENVFIPDLPWLEKQLIKIV